MTDAAGASSGAPVEPTMADVRIRDGIGFATIGERTIVLDVNADRYWQIGEADGETMRRISAGNGPLDGNLVDRLRRFGFIDDRCDGASPSAGDIQLVDQGVPPASASALEHRQSATRSDGSILDVGSRVFGSFMRVRSLPLRQTLESLVRARADNRMVRAASDLSGIAQQFARQRRLIPLKPACLPDTLAFLGFAARRGHFPKIVFGVQASPFRAHCWAQSDDLVLTDPLDRVRAFVPLLAV